MQVWRSVNNHAVSREDGMRRWVIIVYREIIRAPMQIVVQIMPKQKTPRVCAVGALESLASGCKLQDPNCTEDGQ